MRRACSSILLGLFFGQLILCADPENGPSDDDEAWVEEWLRGDDLLAWDLPRDIDELLRPLPLWNLENRLKGGVGYRDNVRRAAHDAEGGAFLLAGFETMVMRLPTDGPRFTLFVLGEHLEFPSSRDLPDDTTLTASSELRFESDNRVTTRVGLAAFYIDQIIDVATFDIPLDPIRVRGFGVTPAASIRKTWENDLFVEGSGSVSRQKFRDPLYDYWEYGPGAAAGWAPARTEISLNVSYVERDFDDRQALSSTGEPLPDTNVAFRILRTYLAARHVWGENRRWRSRTLVGSEFLRDNETDYFAYDRLRLVQQISYEHEKWEVNGRVSYSPYDFKIQTVDENGSTTRRHLWSIGLEVQRNLTESLDLFLRYDHEAFRSNERAHDRDVNTWAAGLGWSF